MKFSASIFLLALATALLRAQAPPQISPDAAAQLIMRPQPPVDNSQWANVSATAEFDPPVVRPGEKTFYRVKINATQNSILWPDKISTPPELRLGPSTRGQLTQPDGSPFRPATEFLYEATPTTAGRFTIPNFVISVDGRSVEIPAASVDVRTDAPPLTPRKLSLEIPVTNLFSGQPFRVRVISPAAQGNQIEALRDVQFNGGEFLTDKLSTHQSTAVVNHNGQLKPSFIYETVATPIATGTTTISAQGFTVSLFSVGPITITASAGPIIIGGNTQSSPLLLVSDAVRLNVRPLPQENELPGFTGAMGRFTADKPQLSTNRIRVGEPVRLKVTFHGADDLSRLVPPAPPRSRAWQVIADKPPATGFTLIPQTDETHETPLIPFSYFNPATAKYVDLTIPALPVTVVGDGLPVQLPAFDNDSQSAAPAQLSGLASAPGKTVLSLRPLQLRGWFVIAQLLPVLGLLALWRWDQHRRFLEAHPELVRRARARRALRSERRRLQQAVAAGDAAAFVQIAAAAMRIAVAPHFPAHPRALVCADVLAQLSEAERNGRAGETVRKIFATVDAQFAALVPATTTGLALAADVEAVLEILEEKL